MFSIYRHITKFVTEVMYICWIVYLSYNRANITRKRSLLYQFTLLSSSCNFRATSGIRPASRLLASDRIALQINSFFCFSPEVLVLLDDPDALSSSFNVTHNPLNHSSRKEAFCRNSNRKLCHYFKITQMKTAVSTTTTTIAASFLLLEESLSTLHNDRLKLG